MVSSVWLFFTVPHDDYGTAKCKKCGAQFQRWGKRRKSFYTGNMMTHLRSCQRYDNVWKENQQAKLLKRNKKVRPGEEEMEENDEKKTDPSTTLHKEEDGLWTVTCGNKTGLLDISKLRNAIECIKCEGQWFAPSAFEDFGGKRSSKKWKQTIIYKDKPLQYWFKQGQLSTKGFRRLPMDCLKETTNLPSDLISEHHSDGNLATPTGSNSPAGSPGEPDSLLSKDSWCQPLEADMLLEEDCLPTKDASSPAAEGPASTGPDVAGEVELTQSPKREDVEMREIQCFTENEPSAPATTAPDVPEGITAVESQGTHAENENTDAEQTSENMTASDSGVPESLPAPSPPPSTGGDLDTMDLHQLKREKLKMQIKVLRLQEEYYARTLGGLLT